ncbi:MAG: hypothetical protein MSH43_00535, partial [Bacteroidales bacterium]|nr:hypothetical protein [Bacteroidales bacterium]
CLLCICGRILSHLAERAKTCRLTLYTLLIGSIHQKVQVDVGKSVYNRMEEHVYYIYILKGQTTMRQTFFRITSPSRLPTYIGGRYRYLHRHTALCFSFLKKDRR